MCYKISSLCDVQVGTATEMGIATTVVETTDVAKGRFTPEVREKDALYELVKLYHAIICNTIYVYYIYTAMQRQT